MNEAQQTAINEAKFCRVSQTVLDWHERKPMTVAAILETAEDIGKLQLVTFTDNEPHLGWGAAIYRVNEDGSLKLHKSNFDTSD